MKRYLAVAVLALVGLALVLVGPGPIKKGEAGPAPTVFLCYSVHATSHGLENIVPTLSDQWGSMSARVGEPRLFCNPADKIVDGFSAAGYSTSTHLTCFSISDQSLQPRDVQESDQFGQLTLAIKRTADVCEPSDKGGIGQTVSTQPSSPFKCYRVDSFSGSFEPATFRVTDQYIGKNDPEITVRRPVLFCNSVEKSLGAGIGVTQIGDTHMTCYRISTRFAFSRRTEYVANQFGSSFTLSIYKPVMLCVSANKVVD